MTNAKYRYRWVSTSLMGDDRITNTIRVEAKGWTSVDPTDYAQRQVGILPSTRQHKLYRRFESSVATTEQKQLDVARQLPTEFGARWQTPEELRAEADARRDLAECFWNGSDLPVLRSYEDWEQLRTAMEDFLGPFKHYYQPPNDVDRINRVRAHLGLPKLLPDGEYEKIDKVSQWRNRYQSINWPKPAA